MEPARLTLLQAIHNHQPVGNFGHVFEQSYGDCYGPLLDALLGAPHVKVALHHTGALFEWIEEHRPGYFDKLRTVVGRGQVELLGGGFYEPMLAVLPERDARGQIDMMSDYLEERFGVRPTGMWLAERVWEPHLAQLIAAAGLKYTLVDDGHFRSAGLGGALRGYYVTEKAGTPLALFPIDKRLREVIPFLKAWETLDEIDRLRKDTPAGLPACVTYGDDGEKLGVWPKTKEWVWGQGWMQEFLRLVAERGDRLQTMTFAEYLAGHPPTGRVYLPTASYEEMGEWTLPAEAQAVFHEVRRGLAERGEIDRARPFFRGGIWQGFLAKYPEANFMHKKMVLVSERLARAEAKLGPQAARALEPARRELYRAQCNCAYWHGLFGGLYLNYLRDAVYHHLIEAELGADRALGEADGTRSEVADLDRDLRDEVLLVSPALAAYVKPDAGGAVYELDYRPKRFNLGNVLGRRAEGYHQKLLEALGRGDAHGGHAPQSIHDLVAVKSEGLGDLLAYDRHPRFTFVDHFLAPDVTLEALAAGRAEERGDFAAGAWQIVSHGAGAVTLRRRGQVDGREVTIDKRIAVAGARLTASYELRAPGAPFFVAFAPELNLTLLAGDAPDRYYRIAGLTLSPEERKLASRGMAPAGRALEMVNEWDRFKLRVEAGPDASIWRYPLETASQSEGGFERTYQGSVLLARLPTVELGEGRPLHATVSVELESL
jgi:alpha-amylase